MKGITNERTIAKILQVLNPSYTDVILPIMHDHHFQLLVGSLDSLHFTWYDSSSGSRKTHKDHAKLVVSQVLRMKITYCGKWIMNWRELFN